MRASLFLTTLADSFVAGEPSVDAVAARLTQTLGKAFPWISPLAQRYVSWTAGRTRPRRRDVLEFLRTDRKFQRAWSKHHHEWTIQHWIPEPLQMQPVCAAKNWQIPAITSIADLADWLALSFSELLWFADLKGLAYRNTSLKLSHYHYRILAKKYGNVRLIEVPKSRIKRLQRQILAQVLERIPPHPSVHGFIKGRSITTFVALHVARRVVLRMDLKDFFPTFAAARIQTLFRTLGYPEAVADLLGGICTNAVPRGIWKDKPLECSAEQFRVAAELYSRPHLPQGAPTSPALANLCTYRVDCRLAGLAASAGATYTRYADDLAFSGEKDFERVVDRFSTHVGAILLEEGFTVCFRKTRAMRQGVRQHLAGLVTNARTNIMRPDFDRLKAILTNSVRYGPESQNRDALPDFRAHLEGRVAFVEMVNSAKGQRLRRIMEQIDRK